MAKQTLEGGGGGGRASGHVPPENLGILRFEKRMNLSLFAYNNCFEPHIREFSQSWLGVYCPSLPPVPPPL